MKSPGRRSDRARRIGLVCGIAAPLVWLALIAFGDIIRPDIDPTVDYVSELGERGSATESLLRYAGFIATGALYVLFAGTVAASATSPRAGSRRSRIAMAIVALLLALDGIGRMGAGVFPCDPGCDGISRSQELHRWFATLGFCSGILAAAVWGLCFRHALSVTASVVATVSLVLMTWTGHPVQAAGLFERLATGVLSVWLLVITWESRAPSP